MQLNGAHEEEYYTALRNELQGDQTTPQLRVDDHPITAVDEVSIGDNLAFTTDPNFVTFKLGIVRTIFGDNVYVQLYVAKEAEEFLGIDRANSNRRTTPTWVLEEEEYDTVSLSSILVLGDIFTNGMKLKVNSGKAIDKFLSQRKAVKDIQDSLTTI